MIRTVGNRRGFTLLELLVVVGMIAVIMGAMATTVSSAQERARKQKATAEVKVITQAILAYEDWSKNGELPDLKAADADASSLGFLFGEGGTTRSGQELPTLLMASLRNGGKILDPWGHPYKVTIKRQNASFQNKFSDLSSGFWLPNFYRVKESERKVIW